MKDALDPFRRRHQPGQLLGQIDASLAPQAQLTAVVRKAVDAQTHPSVVEKDVTGFEDCFVQAHNAVRTLPVNPTLELPAIKSGVARAKSCERLGGILVFQHGRGGNDFENGTGRKLRLNGAIEQRLLTVLVEALPVICSDTAGQVTRAP